MPWKYNVTKVIGRGLMLWKRSVCRIFFHLSFKTFLLIVPEHASKHNIPNCLTFT